MKKKIMSIMISAILVISILAGCGSSEEKEEVDPNKPVENVSKKELEDGKYYIKHRDGTYSALYFGQGTFKQGKTSGHSESRILWYKKDFSYIPTLYLGRGDSLIFYSKETFKEQFQFERFFDLGYSVGICKMKTTKTGRYTISTKTDDNNTFPGGDTDKILEMGEGKAGTVFLDSISGIKIRAIQQENSSQFRDSDYVTQWKTIKGLNKDNYYQMFVYKGTVRKVFKFKADVRILGSAEDYKSMDYANDTDNTSIINIGIPRCFNSGYYLINGEGLFRFVVGNSYDDSTNFNVPNNYPDNNTGATTTTGQDTDGGQYNVNGVGNSFDKVASFTPQQSGETTFILSIPGLSDESLLSGVKAAILCSDGTTYNFSYTGMDENGAYYQCKVKVTAGSLIQIGYSGIPSGYAESLTYESDQ